MTPAARMAVRQAAGKELARPELGNGILFTPAVAPFPNGSFSYGPLYFTYNLSEAATDGAVLTQDYELAGILRKTGLFTEQPQ